MRPAPNKMFMPAWGSVLPSRFVFLISLSKVEQGCASKTQAVINVVAHFSDKVLNHDK